jgi:hypothetical protein
MIEGQKRDHQASDDEERQEQQVIDKIISAWRIKYRPDKERYQKNSFLRLIDIYLDANQDFPLQPKLLEFETFFRYVAIGVQLKDVWAVGNFLKPEEGKESTLIDNIAQEIKDRVNDVYWGHFAFIRRKAAELYECDIEDVTVQTQDNRRLTTAFDKEEESMRLRSVVSSFLLEIPTYLSIQEVNSFWNAYKEVENRANTVHFSEADEIAAYIDEKLQDENFRKYLIGQLQKQRKKNWEVQPRILASARAKLLNPHHTGSAGTGVNLAVIVKSEDKTKALEQYFVENAPVEL